MQAKKRHLVQTPTLPQGVPVTQRPGRQQPRRHGCIQRCPATGGAAGHRAARGQAGRPAVRRGSAQLRTGSEPPLSVRVCPKELQAPIKSREIENPQSQHFPKNLTASISALPLEKPQITHYKTFKSPESHGRRGPRVPRERCGLGAASDFTRGPSGLPAT